MVTKHMKNFPLLMRFSHLVTLAILFFCVNAGGDEASAQSKNPQAKSSDTLLLDDPSLYDNKPYQEELKQIESLQRAKDLDGLVHLADHIEQTWGNQADLKVYYGLMDQLTNELASDDFGDVPLQKQDELAQKYVLITLAHGNVPLDTRTKLLPRLIPEENIMLTKRPFMSSAWAQIRSTCAPQWLQTRQAVQNAVVPNYDMSSPIYMNNVGNSAELKDPKLAEARNKKSLEVSRKIQGRTEQLILRSLDNSFSPLAEKEVVFLYSHPPYNIQELQQFLNAYVDDPVIKQRILDQVAKNIAVASQK